MICILVASAAIPGVFPPVMIQVEARSGLYDEMHVDGGVTSQLHLYPLEFDATTTHEKFNVLGAPKAYVIRNGYVEAHYKAVQRSTLAIAAASMATLMGNISYGDMYRIYLETQRDGVEFELAYVPESFNEPLNEPFDQQYMRKLYEVGYELAIDGYDWKDSPPDYETE